ncbi:MAG TPA: ATP-grasp domain-containing protein [bacterium]|nr:ATP-grasp domain-containing protein [bacterium]
MNKKKIFEHGHTLKKNILLLYDIDSEWTDAEKKEVLDSVYLLGNSLKKINHKVEYLELNSNNLKSLLKSYSPEENIIFNWCESIPGIPLSEPNVVEIIEESGFVYTGSTADVLRLSENKYQTKLMLEKNKINTPYSKVFHSPKNIEWDLFPAIIKSATDHSSLGVTPQSVVLNLEELRERAAFFLKKYKHPALVEVFIDGREFHISLLGNGEIETLPIAEMDFSAFTDIHDRICSFEAKFVPNSKHYSEIQTLLPAPLSEKDYDLISKAAKESYQTIGCRDYARIDIRMKDDIAYVLDVNPNPDISYDASMANAAEISGYSYGEFGNVLLNLAAERFL